MTKLKQQVTEFMIAFNQDRMVIPTMPPPDVVRLRLRLIAEETLELLESCGVDITDIAEPMMNAIADRHDYVCMEAMADALGDLDYVAEGMRLAFGIDGDPIADAIHEANMAKAGGYFDEHRKWRKPPGWQPPDIEGALRAQGWLPP